MHRYQQSPELDERVLAACLAYVDLNPIRARMAETPEESAHTSIKQRVLSATRARQPENLFPFSGNPRTSKPEGLPFRLQDYLELVDWSGRHLREGKRGAIDESWPPILERLQIDPRHWLYLNKNFESRLKFLVDAAHSVHAACERLGKLWAHGIHDCERSLSPPADS